MAVGQFIPIQKQMRDTLSNLFSHIKNAQQNRILVIEHSKSKNIIAILNVLQEHGYIRGYRLIPQKPYKLEILLKYFSANQKPVINNIIRTSKPGRRLYVGVSQLGKKNSIRQGYQSNIYGTHKQKKEFLFMQGILIISTSKGIVSDIKAHKLNVGGELLCQVY
jgi:small subunit ribosomal protein S8